MIKWIKNLFKKKEEPIIPFSPTNNWTISTYNNRVVYKIPVGSLSKEKAEKYLKQLISNYSSPINTKCNKIERILNRIQPK